MQNHLAAAANQATGSWCDVGHLKDKVFIQKVQPGLWTYISTSRRKVRLEACLQGCKIVGWVLFYLYQFLFRQTWLYEAVRGIFSNEWEVWNGDRIRHFIVIALLRFSRRLQINLVCSGLVHSGSLELTIQHRWARGFGSYAILLSLICLCVESESVGSKSVNPEDWGQRDSRCF